MTIPDAVTTRAEIEIFKRETLREGWSNLLDLSTEDHTPHIKKALEREFTPLSVDVAVINVEDVLTTQVSTGRYKNIIGQFRRSGRREGQFLRESVLGQIDQLSIIGDIFDWLAHRIPSKCYWENRITNWLGRESRF